MLRPRSFHCSYRPHERVLMWVESATGFNDQHLSLALQVGAGAAMCGGGCAAFALACAVQCPACLAGTVLWVSSDR